LKHGRASRLALLSILALMVFLGSCRVAGTTESQVDLEKAFHQTYQAEIESDLLKSGPKAAAPRKDILAGTISIPSGEITAEDYPEYGQKTTYQVGLVSANHYKVTVKTMYKETSVKDKTTEVYYINDVAPLGIYDVNDPIVEPVNWTWNTKYRETMETDFMIKGVLKNPIKATRTETIASDNSNGDAHFPTFDYAAGSMDFDAALPGATVASGEWSSTVTYTQTIPTTLPAVQALLSFFNSDNYVITGTRYYTENPKTVDASGYDYIHSTLWKEEVKDNLGRLIMRTVIREEYDAKASSFDRSIKRMKSRSVFYDASGDERIIMTRNGWEDPVFTFRL